MLIHMDIIVLIIIMGKTIINSQIMELTLIKISMDNKIKIINTITKPPKIRMYTIQ